MFEWHRGNGQILPVFSVTQKNRDGLKFQFARFTQMLETAGQNFIVLVMAMFFVEEDRQHSGSHVFSN